MTVNPYWNSVTEYCYKKHQELCTYIFGYNTCSFKEGSLYCLLEKLNNLKFFALLCLYLKISLRCIFIFKVSFVVFAVIFYHPALFMSKYNDIQNYKK